MWKKIDEFLKKQLKKLSFLIYDMHLNIHLKTKRLCFSSKNFLALKI